MRAKTSLRRLTAMLLCLVMLVQTVTVASAAGFSPKTETPEPTAASAFEFSKGEITDYVGTDTNVVIPAAIDGVAVTRIGQAAFMAKDIENVVIPSTVTYVDDYAFDYCASLEGLYFYGACPANLGSATYDMDTDTVIYCKGTYLSDYEYEMGDDFTVSGAIGNSLADPAYPAAPSHNWVYTDNGDGTHSAKCADEGCTAVITNEAHTYTDGVCVCGAKVDPSAPGYFTYSVENGAAAITGYTGPGGEITLPSTYTKDGVTYPVTSVAARAFNGSNGTTAATNAESLSKITKITVPASITAVGDYGFYYVGRYASRLWSLKEIVFQAEHVAFGASALGKNPNLTSVTLPAGQTELPDGMFYEDTSLAELTVPATVAKVGQLAFQNCTALRKVTFLSAAAPEMGVSSGYGGGQYPFVGCQELVLYVPDAAAYRTAWAAMLAAGAAKAGDITLADNGGVAYIPDFKDYVNGTTASSYNPQYLEYRVVSFDNAAKTGAVELKYVGWSSAGKPLVIPSAVTVKVLGEDWTFTVVGIGANAIDTYKISDYSSSAYAFTQVTFPETLTYIRKWGCTGLSQVTDIDLSGTQVTEIGEEAFRGCAKLATVRLPATLTRMGISRTVSSGDEEGGQITITSDENIFACCDALENIYVAQDNPSFKDVDGILYSKDGKKLIRYPNGRPAAEFAIPEGVEVIASQAFMQSYKGDSKLTKVTFPATLKQIESLAFRQSSLTEVTLPAGVTFGSCAFDICKKLEKVTISQGVTALSDYMFWSDEAITEIRLPASLKKIGANCFGHCTALASVDLNRVEDIGSYAFYYTPITEVTVPATANTIGRGAFAVCQQMTKVTFQEGCRVIAPFMFTSNHKLSDLTLADSIEDIGEYAFNQCVALTQVTLPKSLKTMGDAVFYQCWQSLKSVTFPDEVELTYLPASTFESCQALTYVYLGKNIFSTKPVSLYDTNPALVVECAVAEKRFNRNPFDVYGWDLSDRTLFASCEDTGDRDANGYPIYKIQLTEAGESGGCCGGGTPVDGYYYVSAGANPTFRHGTYEPVVLTVTGRNADGETVTASFTKTQLEDLSRTEPVIGYQYWRSGVTETVVASNRYVTVTDLMKAAGIVFDSCDTVTASAQDGFGATMSHADSLTHKYYIHKDGAKTEVPAALLLSWNTGTGTLDEVAAAAYDSGSIRFGYGITEAEYGSVHGRRIVNNVASLTVNVHAAHEDVQTTPVTENVVPPTCTEPGSHDEVIYCAACKDEISRTTVTDPSAGHKDGPAVIENRKDPTCTQDGSYDEVVYCAVCSTELSRHTVTEPATGHDTELVGAKAATCTEDGYTGDEVCKTCGETVKKGEAIPATGHDYKDGKCTVCGADDPNYQPEQPEKPEQPEDPGVKTGDSAQITLWSGVLVMAAMAGYVLLRKRKAG